jgi:hypothetical protein
LIGKVVGKAIGDQQAASRGFRNVSLTASRRGFYSAAPPGARVAAAEENHDG